MKDKHLKGLFKPYKLRYTNGGMNPRMKKFMEQLRSDKDCFNGGDVE